MILQHESAYRGGQQDQSPVRSGGTGEFVHGATPSVATSAEEARLMSDKSTRMVGEMSLAGVIAGQFEFPQQIVCASFSFVVTCSDHSYITVCVARTKDRSMI